MSTIRTFLRLDALASGGVGILLLALVKPAESELGLPITFSVIVGLVMLGWAAFVGWVSIDAKPAWVKEVIALNLVYVAGSVAVAVAGWFELSDLGVAIVLAQGFAVLGLTLGQYAGFRTAVPEMVS